MTKLFLIITLFCVISAVSNPSWCPSNGLVAQSDGTCLVALHDGTAVSHVDAASRCRSYSSYHNEYQLPTVKTPQKHIDVQSWLSSHPMRPRSGWLIVWLNLEREFTQSKDLSVWRRRTDWRWRDGDSSISDALGETMWSMWREGEPNNNFPGSNEYCVCMVLFDSNLKEKTFFDAPCGEQLLIPSMILCEKKPPLTTTTQTSTTTSTSTTSTSTTSTTTTTLPLTTTTTTQLSTPTSSASTSAFFPNATVFATQLIADPYLGISTNCICTCAEPKFPFITSPPGTATIAILVILYVLGAVIISVGLYLFISAKRRIRKARKEGGAKMHYHLTGDTDNID